MVIHSYHSKIVMYLSLNLKTGKLHLHYLNLPTVDRSPHFLCNKKAEVLKNQEIAALFNIQGL